MLYPVELRALKSNFAGFTYEKPHRCNTNVSFSPPKIFRTKSVAKRATIGPLQIAKDVRLSFHVYGRVFYLAPLWRIGGPYYIRFEPPSNCGKRVGTVHLPLKTNVITAAKARAN
jgi:hypothetical protein